MRAVITIDFQTIKIETPYKILRLDSEIHLKRMIRNIKEGNILPEYEYIFGTYALVELIEYNKKGKETFLNKVYPIGKIYKITKKSDPINLKLITNKKRLTTREVKGKRILYIKMWNDFFDKIININSPLKFFLGFEKTDYKNYRLYRTLFLRKEKDINNSFFLNSLNSLEFQFKSKYVLINVFFEFPKTVLAEILSDSLDISPYLLNGTGKFIIFFREFNDEDFNILKGLTNECFPNEDYFKKLLSLKPDLFYKNISLNNIKLINSNIKIKEIRVMSEVDNILSKYIIPFKEINSYRNTKLVSSIETQYFKQMNFHRNTDSKIRIPSIDILRQMVSRNNNNNSFQEVNKQIINDANLRYKSKFGDLPPAKYDEPINNIKYDPSDYTFIPPTIFPKKNQIKSNDFNETNNKNIFKSSINDNGFNQIKNYQKNIYNNNETSYNKKERKQEDIPLIEKKEINNNKVHVYTPFKNYIKEEPSSINTERLPGTFSEYMEQQKKINKQQSENITKEKKGEETNDEYADMPDFLI